MGRNAQTDPFNTQISTEAVVLDKCMDNDQLAETLGVSPRTTERWRFEGAGPIFRKLGRRVVYLESDVLAWIDGQARRSTSDNTPGGSRSA